MDEMESRTSTKQCNIAFFKKLPLDLINDIGDKWLTLREALLVEKEVSAHQQLQRENRPNTTLFNSFLPQKEAGYAVLRANPEELLRILAEENRTQDNNGDNPTSLFFKKCARVNDPSGNQFYNISPAELINMVIDDEMQQQVDRFVDKLPEDRRQRFSNDWKKQHASRGRGGADLVKVINNPMLLSFDMLLEVKKTYEITYADPVSYRSAVFPLLQNPNGLIYYKDNVNQVHWYYADKEKRTLQEIRVNESIELDKYHLFKLSMDKMEPMSARRSNNEEYKLISAIMQGSQDHQPIQLVREGHQYVRNEIPLSRILSTLDREEFLRLKSFLHPSDHALIDFATEDNYQDKFFSYTEYLCLYEDVWRHHKFHLVIPTPVPISYCDTQYDFNRYYNANPKLKN